NRTKPLPRPLPEAERGGRPSCSPSPFRGGGWGEGSGPNVLPKPWWPASREVLYGCRRQCHHLCLPVCPARHGGVGRSVLRRPLLLRGGVGHGGGPGRGDLAERADHRVDAAGGGAA